MNCNMSSDNMARNPGVMTTPCAVAGGMQSSGAMTGEAQNAGAPMQNPAAPGGQWPSMDRFPVGMGYVPMQNWEEPYPMEQGFHRGTIFPSLDLPFMMGRCRR